MPLGYRLPWLLLAGAGLALLFVGETHGGSGLTYGNPSTLGVLLLLGAAGAYLAQHRPASAHQSYRGPGRGYYRFDALRFVVLAVVLLVGSAAVGRLSVLPVAAAAGALAIAASCWRRGNWAHARQLEAAEPAAQDAPSARYRWGDAVIVTTRGSADRHRGERGVVVGMTGEGGPRYTVQFADGSTEDIAESALEPLGEPSE